MLNRYLTKLSTIPKDGQKRIVVLRGKYGA